MDLTQENYELSQKLDLAKTMERAYLEEIEGLRENVRMLEIRQSETVGRLDTSSQIRCAELEERLAQTEESLASLKAELRLSKEREAQLHEKLAIAESRLEAVNSETSLSTVEPNQPDLRELMVETATLNEALETLKVNHQIERSKLERLVADLEEEKAALQSDICELSRHLKDSRNELADMRAQMDAVQLQQASAASSARGNSAFSELEDRRVRAEELVKKQRGVIEDLRSQLVTVQAEGKRKLEEELTKLETRFRERDTQFTDNLVAERKRLMDENRILQLQLQQMEELHIDNEKRASTLSKAFNLGGTGQESLVSTLERRIATLQKRLAEKTASVDGLRERMLKAYYQRKQMQTELWNQMDLTKRLSEQLERYNKQRIGDEQPLKPVQEANEHNPRSEEGPTKDGVTLTQDNERFESLQNEVENTPSAQSRPEEPLHPCTMKQSKTNVIHLNTVPTIKTKNVDVPPDCKTS